MQISLPYTLADLFPLALPVTLARQTYRVDPFRLRDLATLEHLLRQVEGDPLGGIPAASDDPEPNTRKTRLKAAFDRAITWAGRDGSDVVAKLLATDAGTVAYLHLCVGRDDPEFSHASALSLATHMTAADWDRLNRAVWQVDPAAAVLGEVQPEGEGNSLGSLPDPERWAKLVVELITLLKWTPEQIGGLYLSQIGAILNGGKARQVGRCFYRTYFASSSAARRYMQTEEFKTAAERDRNLWRDEAN